LKCRRVNKILKFNRRSYCKIIKRFMMTRKRREEECWRRRKRRKKYKFKKRKI